MATQKRSARSNDLYDYPVLCCRSNDEGAQLLPRTDAYVEALRSFLAQQPLMREHAFDNLCCLSPFGSVAPWKVFVELFIDNVDNPNSKDHDYSAEPHEDEAVLPFVLSRGITDPCWTVEEASFIVKNLQAPPRDWTYLCVVRDRSTARMAISWLDRKGEWYKEKDPRTDAAEDDFEISFEEDDNNDEANQGADLYKEATQKTDVGVKRTNTHNKRLQPPAKKRKRTPATATTKKSKARPVAKASKFSLPATQTYLDKWLHKN